MQRHSARAVTGILCAAVLMIAPRAKADIQTSLTFATPSTIQAGGSVTVDFAINFIPTVAATTGVPMFVDDTTSNDVSSCSVDPNACTELQFNTTASALVPGSTVFAEVLAATTATQVVPTFYPFTTLGSHPLTFNYPDPGRYEITVAGPGDQEQFSLLECTTPWDNGAVDGSTSCSTLLTPMLTGAFDPQGTPDVFVTVNMAAPTPEPASLMLFCTGLLGLAFLVRKRAASILD